MTFSFFSPSPRGLEQILGDEITALGGHEVDVVPGGVAFKGDEGLLYQANLHSRIATRVLLNMGQSAYDNENAIYDFAFSIDWPQWFQPQQTIKVTTTAIRCPLKSVDFVTLKIKDAICDRFRKACGARPSVDIREPDIRIHAFIHERRITLYLDTSGEPLYKRTGRPGSHEAPLKENLAAGILSLTQWDPETPLVDPMCGSGSFLVEAAQRALNIAPGQKRSFGFEKLRTFNAKRWAQCQQAAREAEKPKQPLEIVGADRFGRVLKLAQMNLEAAGLADCVTLRQASLLELKPPFPAGTLVMNPPYGVRLNDIENPETFYRDFGNRLKECYHDYHVWILSADRSIPEWIRLKPKRKTPLYNGNIECRLYGFDIVSGSFRRHPPIESTAQPEEETN